MKYILCFVSFCALSSVSAQVPENNPYLFNHTASGINNIFNHEIRPDADNRIVASFDYFTNSNAVPAQFVYKMLFKGEITSKLKDRAEKRIKNSLFFEDYLKTGVEYRRRIKKWNAEVYAGYHHRQMRNLSSRKETFQLVFTGNARFEDDTADLSNIRFQNFIYNQYTVGIKKEFNSGELKFNLGIGLSFIQAISHQQINTKEAWLYTAPDGEFLYMKYDLKYNTADEGATPSTEMNGIGASGDIHFSISNPDQWKLSIDATDLGGIAFSRNPVNYSGADFVRFRGIELPNLLSFSSSTFDTLNIDSALTSNLPDKTNSSYSTIVPFTLSLVYSQAVLNNKLVVSVGAQYRYLPRYLFYGYLKANYFIRPDISFSVSAGAGGYSRFNLGVEFAKSWKYFDLALGTGNLIGLVAPTHYQGMGLYLRMGTSF